MKIGIKFSFSILLILLLSPNASLQQEQTEDDDDTPVVTTRLGKIQGKILKSQKGVNILSFRGIRYAKAPINELRFAPPQPIEPWNDTLRATSDSLVCPQPGVQQLMTENCLVVNVYTRNLTRKLPVMVYIHGGANVLGSGHSVYEAGPQYLLDHDIVLVSLNYRLGALGFLSTGAGTAATGNYGYLDQVLALQWVQQHIDSFGGDANSVTLLGLSAGAMAVSLHIASPLSANLFHRAILMSGAATNAYAIDNLYWTRKLAREVSCPMYDPQDMVDCLRGVSWKTIMNVCSEWEPYKMTNMKWNYEIDGHFLQEHPTLALANKRFNRVPVIIGINRNELDYSVYHQENNTGLLHDITVNFDMYAPEFFLYNQSVGPSVSERLWQHYMGNSTLLTPQNLKSFGEMFSDGIIGHGVHRFVQLMREAENDVYVYFMRFPVRRSNYPGNTDGGVAHADDFQYVMPGLWYGAQLKPDDPEMFMVERMTKLFTTFAIDGVPNTDEQPDIKWNTTGTLHIDRRMHVETEPPYAARYALWDELFPRSGGASSCTFNVLLLCVELLVLTRTLLSLLRG